MTKEEIKVILKNHKHWLMEDCEGWEDMRANLRNADLSNADLSNADLRYADLSNAKNLYIHYACPDFGSFIGWKKARWKDDEVIVMLEIPDDAKRLSATGRKCRCDKAKVIAIESIVGLTAYREAHSIRDKNFIYRVGETVTVADFDEDRWNECSEGIHFFINRQEAVNYEM